MLLQRAAASHRHPAFSSMGRRSIVPPHMCLGCLFQSDDSMHSCRRIQTLQQVAGTINLLDMSRV